MLEGTLAKSKRVDELIAVSSERVKLRDTAASRYNLAKAYALAGKFKETEDEVRTALAKEPGAQNLQVALAALLLRRAETPEVLAEAGKQLDQARAALGNNPPADLRWTYEVNRGIFLALSGDAQARVVLQGVLQQSPEHEAAKAALKALDRLAGG
jgi:predicted Zn-dependent protease